MTNKKMVRAGLFASLFLFVLVVLIGQLPSLFLPTKLSVEVQSQQSDNYQVFYDTGNGYNETESVTVFKPGSTTFETIDFWLPAKKINKIRIDPGTKSGNIFIRRICAGSLFKQHCWRGQDLFSQCRPLHDISKFEVGDAYLSIVSTGEDPNFELKGDFSLHQSAFTSYGIYFFAVIVSIVFFFILLREEAIIHIADASLPVLEWMLRYRYIISAALFIILVAAKLHGSSLPEWDKIVKEKINQSDKSLLFGQPRGIRSDEWNLQTPMYLSQVESKSFFPLINPNIRSDGQNMLVISAPVFDITLVSKPFNWGFFFLGKARGLSWYWWSKLFLLLLTSYEFCLFLARGDKLLSFVGALWIAFSPFVQWFFSSGQVDLIIYSQAIIVISCHYLVEASRQKKILLAAILSISIIGFILALYPGFQVPLGYFILIFIAAYTYTNRASIKLEKFDFFLLSLSLFVIIVVILAFVARSMDAMKIIAGTVHPGKRFITGGGYDMNFLQFYLIDWLTPFKELPSITGCYSGLNRCEVSTFVNFVPAGLFVFFSICRKDTTSRSLGIAILCYILFQVSWLTIKYPDWFARWSFYFPVLQQRLQEVIGLVAVYLSIWLFSFLAEHKPLTLVKAFGISLFTMLLYSYSLNHTFMSGYLTPVYMTLTLVFFFMGNCFFLLGKKRLFALFIIFFIVVAGLTVNPISKGVGPIYNKVISQKILQIDRAHPGQQWAAANSAALGNLVVALGVKSMNSSQFYPDMNRWRILDPLGKYANCYNRYATVCVQVVETGTHFEFNRKIVDLFTLYITPEDLKRVGVKYILSNGCLAIQSPILKEIDKVESDNLYIYEVQA